MCGFIPYKCHNYDICQSYVMSSGCIACKKKEGKIIIGVKND